MMKSVQEAVVDNPVTTVAGIGVLISGVGALLKWDDATMQAIAQVALGLCLVARSVVAMFQRKPTS